MKHEMCKKYHNKLLGNEGFSLMEVLVVMSVVVIGLLGVSSLSLQNVQVQNMNNEELVASMLAQEGIELTRNIRDWNWINLPYDNWKASTTDGSNFIVDYRTNLPFPGPVYYDDSYGDDWLYIDGGGKYSHDNAGTRTRYHRYVETSNMTETSDVDDATRVVCHVNWRSSGRDHSYSIESHLYHWR